MQGSRRPGMRGGTGGNAQNASKPYRVPRGLTGSALILLQVEWVEAVRMATADGGLSLEHITATRSLYLDERRLLLDALTGVLTLSRLVPLQRSRVDTSRHHCTSHAFSCHGSNQQSVVCCTTVGVTPIRVVEPKRYQTQDESRNCSATVAMCGLS